MKRPAGLQHACTKASLCPGLCACCPVQEKCQLAPAVRSAGGTCARPLGEVQLSFPLLHRLQRARRGLQGCSTAPPRRPSGWMAVVEASAAAASRRRHPPKAHSKTRPGWRGGQRMPTQEASAKLFPTRQVAGKAPPPGVQARRDRLGCGGGGAAATDPAPASAPCLPLLHMPRAAARRGGPPVSMRRARCPPAVSLSTGQGRCRRSPRRPCNPVPRSCPREMSGQLSET